MSKPWKALVLADLHCGCPRLDPHHFLACIEEYVIPRITPDLSHVIIAGDFFDLLLTMNSLASMVAMTVIGKLKKACFESGVKLRVLRGTFTHDRRQPTHFIVSSPEYNSCVKLFDSMAIEYDEDTDTNILYMPDNLAYDDIYAEVESLLESHHLQQVDVVVHHGYFKHMLPYGIPEPKGTLDYEKFKKFYKGCVLNGHVHTTSIHNNVVSIGSFDRIAYGEEEGKGFYIVTRNEDGVYSFEFVENKHANPFWTISVRDFSGDSLQACLDWLDSESSGWCSKIQAAIDKKLTVHVRIASDDQGVVETCKNFLALKYPSIIIDRCPASKVVNLVENVALNLDELPQVTPDNLESLLMPFIKKTHPNANADEIHAILEECKGVKQNG